MVGLLFIGWPVLVLEVDRPLPGLLLLDSGRCLARQGLRRFRQSGLTCLTGDRASDRRAGRAEIMGSREGAKPRRFDENRTIFFCESIRGASLEPLANKGQPGP